MNRMASRVAGALLAAAFASACVPILPREPVRRALARDIEKIVDVRDEVQGWLVDEIDVQAILPDAMQSVCRAPEAERAAALAWMDEEIARRGGPPIEAWKRNGKDMSGLASLMLLYRSRLLLATATEWADEGKCPFWIEPVPAFDGRQTFAGRLLLTLETGARLLVGFERVVIANTDGGETKKMVVGGGAGGSGRLLVGYGVSDALTLLVGADIAGAARFTDIQLGKTLDVPAVIIVGATPVVARYHMLTSHLELEGAPIGYLNLATGRIDLGMRAGVGVGLSHVRMLRGIVPGGTLSLTYDQAFNGGLFQVTAGFRATFALSR